MEIEISNNITCLLHVNIVQSVILGPHQTVRHHPSAVLIKEVRAFVFSDDDDEKTAGGGADCHKQSEGHWIVGETSRLQMRRRKGHAFAGTGSY